MLDNVRLSMSGKKAFFSLGLLMFMFGACTEKAARTEPTDAARKGNSLLKNEYEEGGIERIVDDDPSSDFLTYEDNEQFVKSLAEHPEMMDMKAEVFYQKYEVSVDESDDKQLRLYSWFLDNGMGGRYSNFTRQAYQFRGASGVHTVGNYLASIFPDDDSPFLDGNTWVGEIMTFRFQNGKKLYVIPYHVVAAGGLTVYSFCAVTINGDELTPVAAFPVDKGKAKKYVLSREIDFLLAPGQMHEQGAWEEPYMKRGHNLLVKTEQVEEALYNVYLFDGYSFVDTGKTVGL